MFRDSCMNEAIWLFSYRYWHISFVIPWKLQSLETPRWFIWLSNAIWFVGCLANLCVPVAYASLGWFLNSSLDKSESYAE